MGVTGLLRLLQPYSAPREASFFRGQTLGVDGYSWLHRAAASCAEDLLRGVPSPKLVQSIDNRVRCYEHYGAELYFVFDGASLGMKQRVEMQRRRARQAARAQSEASGATSGSFGTSQALRGVDITASHAAMVIAYLKVRGIKFVVAPYEADAQLVWLEREGIIDGIISEDSDLLVFGAQNLLTKCDAKTGACVHISSSQIPRPLSDLMSLRALAIISGCDYSPGVNGLGPVKTNALVSKFSGNLEAIVQHLIAGGRVEPEFAELARQADLAFQYQRVWNPKKCCLTYLTEPEEDMTDILTDAIVGAQMSRAEAHRLAIGLIDPMNLTTELTVDPVITRFVQRMRPYRSPKQSVYSTPLGVSRVANRRLNLPATTSASTPVPSTPSISRFFSSAKKPGLPTPPPQVAGSPSLSSLPESATSKGFTSKSATSKSATSSFTSLPSTGSPNNRRTKDPDADKENTLYVKVQHPPSSLLTPNSTRTSTRTSTDTFTDTSTSSSESTLGSSSSSAPLKRSFNHTGIMPTKSDTIVDTPLKIKVNRSDLLASEAPIKMREAPESPQDMSESSMNKLASIRRFAFRPT